VCEHINDTPVDEPIKVEVKVGEITVLLEGWSRRLFKSGAVYYRSGNLRPQDILQSWIQHLCLSCMGHDYKTSILCMDKQVELPPLRKELALEALKELVEGYVEGMCAPLAFFPRTSFDGVMAGYSKKSNTFEMQRSPLPEKVLVKMETSFSGGFSSNGESSNSYISRVWPEYSEELAEEAYSNGLKYLAPAIAVMKEI
jgi:exodeoxyribonuclease V gamma subunit